LAARGAFLSSLELQLAYGRPVKCCGALSTGYTIIAGVRYAFSEIRSISLSLLDCLFLSPNRESRERPYSQSQRRNVPGKYNSYKYRRNGSHAKRREGPTLLDEAATNAGKLHVVCVSDRRYAWGRRRARLCIMMLMMPRHDCVGECFKVHAIAIRTPDKKLLFADVIHIVASFGL